MSADTSGEAATPNLNLSPDEKRVYGQLFRQADHDSVGVVTGEIAVKFFERTRLDAGVLGRIWQIADKENRGFLTPAGFSIALRLIAHAQAGREPTYEIAFQTGPVPRFDGFVPQGAPGPRAPPGSPPPANPIQAQGTGGPVRIPGLTPDKVAQFSSLFERQQLQNGNMLPGDHARQIFDKSGLPNEALSKIWELADTEQRGALVQTEFIIAMHLLTSMKTGTMRSLPNQLPAALYEAATLRGPAAAQRQSPSSTGMSAIPRQMSGQAQQRTGSPLGRTAIPAQHSGSASDWAVTPADKARFDQIYSDLDKTNKGYITGEEAVPFMSQSGLSEDHLAQIWDLADFNSQGTLTREGFAIAMYLIRQQRGGRGVALPSTLPANLVPPSMRNQARQPPAASAFEPPPMKQPPPPQPKSALDDLFGLDSGPSSPAHNTAALAPAPTGGSSQNDPFASGPASGAAAPSSPIRAQTSGNNNKFTPFVPSSSFGRGLTVQHSGGSAGGTARSPEQPSQASAADDLLSDNDGEASKNISTESTDLANLSHQIGTLSKQTQDTQAKRNNTQTELNQTNSQKQNFEQRLAQLRTLYEKEARDTRALEEQLRNSRNETKKLQGECMTLEGTYKDTQAQHQEVLGALQADQKENANLRERIRVVNAEIAQLKPQIDKLKSDGRQQRGLVAINKKQLSTTEGERDKLKTEAADLAKGPEESAGQAAAADSNRSTPAPVASPSLSTASGNNPFFNRTASTDIMGAVASPPARTFSHQSFDEVFGPSQPSGSTGTPPPPAAAPFKPQTTGASSASIGSASTPPVPAAPPSRSGATEPPAPPESRQITPSFLPMPHHSDSLTSSRQVSPPASRAEGSGNEATNPFPGEAAAASNNLPGAFPDDDEQKQTPVSSPAPEAAKQPADDDDTSKPSAVLNEAAPAPNPFGGADDAKAKADFENAFAAFTSASKDKGKDSEAPPAAAKSTSAFDTEFPPISELNRDESDSDSDDNGFDDDFAPTSPGRKSTEKKTATAADDAEAETSKSDAASPTPQAAAAPAVQQEASRSPEASAENPSSPATITNSTAPVHEGSTADDLFGAAATGTESSTHQAAPSKPPGKEATDDLDDEFEGLEDAKEGSADDDFANVSRSGFDDFNAVFDSSPPPSQTKSESTAFGNESSFDFIPANSTTGAPAPSSENQQRGADAHDWDAIFSGLDSPSATATPGADAGSDAPTAKPASPEARPAPVGRALTEKGEHDDPILKNLTGMGYSRADAVTALEKYDYNLERAANYLASQS